MSFAYFHFYLLTFKKYSGGETVYDLIYNKCIQVFTGLQK